MQISVGRAKSHVMDILRARLVPMIHGSPAVGKSSIIHQVAKEFNLKLIDVRLSTAEPTDLTGFPDINEKTGKATYIPMDTFPLEGDEVPEGYNGWLIFFDEISSASRAIQAAAYKILLDRMVGQRNLHKQVAMACAGNLETDGAIVEPMSTALQSRLVHLEVTPNVQEWREYAASEGWDHRITAYINWKPGSLYNFTADHTDKTYASPRTWEFADRFTRGVENLDEGMLVKLAGTLGEGEAREFITFTKIYRDLPTMGQILEAGKIMKVPEEPSILFALVGAMSHNATEENCGALMDFVKRMPIEFQVVALREMVRRNRALDKHPAIIEWISGNAQELF